MQNAIDVNKVGKAYRSFQLNKISFQCPKGEVMGLIGPNGAGKSTLIRILMGLIQQDSGSVEVLGHRMPAACVQAKKEIGFLSEDMRLYEKATLAWHMHFVNTIFSSWDQKYANDLCEKFDLRDDQTIKTFSHGQRVKAGLLLALAHRPKLLILDEPTTGLDPVARTEVFEEIADVLKDENRTVFFSSHNTYDVEKIADRIAFLDHGHLVDLEEKETFLERWRRIRLVITRDIPDKEHVQVKINGRIAHVITANFSPQTVEQLAQYGQVLGVEKLTLEEIFISAVKRNRLDRKGITV